MSTRGLILAGGTGSRMWPVTGVLNKHLLPVFDKPMIYYPLANLMLSGIQEIAIVSTPEHLSLFKKLLGNGSNLGISLRYYEQQKPGGIVDALESALGFIAASSFLVQLGDNFFYGSGLPGLFGESCSQGKSGKIYVSQVSTPQNYGVLEVVDDEILSIEEKPRNPKSNLAVAGIYRFEDGMAEDILKLIPSSKRGEKEITSLLEVMNNLGELEWSRLPRGSSWLDMGTSEDLSRAASFVKNIQQRQGLLIGSPEEIAVNMGWVPSTVILERFRSGPESSYIRSLISAIG